MKKLLKRTVAIGLAAALAVAALVGTAYAYFTDQVSASGEKAVGFGYDYETTEEIRDGNKFVRIKNTGQTDIAVRVLVFGAGEDDNRHRTEVFAEPKWWNPQHITEDALCYQYSKPLAPGESTYHELEVRVTAEGADLDDDFEVIVVGQSSPVVYDEDSEVRGWYAYDWQNADGEN